MLFISLVGVRDYGLDSARQFLAYSTQPFDRDQVLIPSVPIDSFDVDRVAFKPILDVLWNSAGFEGCAH
jgi:hypothetical protein